jgi:DNA-binding HxlR family transcriptional regulator
MTTSGPDTDLFALFGNAEMRLVMEALLRGPARQSKLAAQLGIDTRPLGVAVRKLEVAGLVARTSARGDIGLTHFDAIAGLMEAEASLSKEIQELKVEKAKRRSRDLRKSRMQGGVKASPKGEAAADR